MADDTLLNANTSTGSKYRDKDGRGPGSAHTQVIGIDLAIGGATEDLMNGVMPTGKVSDTPESYNDGDKKPVSLTPEGYLRVAIAKSNLENDWQVYLAASPWGGDDIPWEGQGEISYV